MEKVISKLEIAEFLNSRTDNKKIEVIYNKINSRNGRVKLFRFIDLFAGIGGIRLPFEKLGGECVFSSEWDKNCQKTYFSNYGEVPYGDINSVKLEEIPKHDVLLGGFPCQAFSVAGYRKGFEDTRGTLFFNIAEIINYRKPKAFLLENVKGLLNHDKGETYRRIRDVLKELKYAVFENVLNSMTHANIPQNRERIFIVGIRKDIYKQPFVFPDKTDLTKKIHEFLDSDKQEDKYYYNNHKYNQALSKAVTSRDTIYQWRRMYVRENKNNVCPTLTANMGTGGHNVPIIKDDYGIRKLTPKECLRFQGFPNDFILPDLPDSKLYYQIGNSVTIPLVEKVARKLLKYINFIS